MKSRTSESLRHAEEKKPAIEGSFTLAFQRGLIHVLPISVAVSLVAMNLAGIYIGPSLGYRGWTTTYTLATLQITAKVQVRELLASILL